MSERDQFEAAWIAANSDSKEKADKVRDALRNIWRDNGSGGGAYFDLFVMMAWTWWKASREALKAEQGEPTDSLRDSLIKTAHHMILRNADNPQGELLREIGRLALSRLDGAAVDGWIACSDRMPDDGENVTVCDHGVDVYPAVFIGGEFYEYGDGLIENALRMSNPTHWQPLPSPPTINHPIDTTPNQYDALGKGGEQ
ncbi:DUF551 domain-containing protein [Enterobacter sp. DE0047]|uniref:DUF551 domain-containing protein n=1 Tax=Enterobacter sp. DE0047 TaxID=2584949 RepID=UPI001643AE8D|nr:DUF551 domain-containing protein [Enterobacter sp. DE0047]